MNKKERNAMFKIHDDKVYFVAETPDINILQSVVSYGWEHWNRDFPE